MLQQGLIHEIRKLGHRRIRVRNAVFPQQFFEPFFHCLRLNNLALQLVHGAPVVLSFIQLDDVSFPRKFLSHVAKASQANQFLWVELLSHQLHHTSLHLEHFIRILHDLPSQGRLDGMLQFCGSSDPIFDNRFSFQGESAFFCLVVKTCTQDMQVFAKLLAASIKEKIFLPVQVSSAFLEQFGHYIVGFFVWQPQFDLHLHSGVRIAHLLSPMRSCTDSFSLSSSLRELPGLV
mmetsp:Transcript_5265/g.33078  ORF Transcript_5265/g.33078 Transcript_5265/m.33078 type:complete len:233 (+) Transcript_5265:725-1423(+)